MEALDEHGLDAGLWVWLDKKANRKTGIVTSMDLKTVEDEGARRVLGSRSTHDRERVRYALRNLVDRDILEVVDGSGSSRLKVLVKPPSGKFSVELSLPQSAPGARWSSLVLRTGVRNPTTVVGGPGGYGGANDGTESKRLLVRVGALCQESAQKSVEPPQHIKLARDVFPQLLRQHQVGIQMPQGDWPILAKNLRLWNNKYGMSYRQIHEMMKEFMHHPEWCRNARTAPWKIFLARRSELEVQMDTRRRRDPSNRRYPKGEDYWTGPYQTYRRSAAEMMA